MTPPLVLHVIPTRIARGGQREARAIADQLDEPGVRDHRVLNLFAGVPEVRADFSLDFPGGDVPAAGFDPRLVLALRSALRRFDPALVVAHGGDPLKYLVPALIGRRRPLAYYAIGTFPAGRSSRSVALWRQLLRRVDVVAAEGDEVRAEYIERFGVPPEHITMTPNGRDPAVFHPRPQGLTTGQPAPMVTFVGALTTGKRPDRFIEVVAAARARGLEFRARLIGDGELMDQIREPARQADVELLGSRSDVAELLRSSDIMVFPSLPQGEGMPGVLIEGGLTGLPIVATDVPGVRTVILPGETGFIRATEDVDGMVDDVVRLINDADLRTAMGEAALERCLTHFSEGAVGRTWLRLLTPLLPPGSVSAR